MPLFSKFWRQQNGASDPQRLRAAGAALQVEIAVPPQLAAALQQAGQPIPAPHIGLAIIDTGASVTTVDVAVLNGLGLSPTGTANVATPSTTSVQQPIYACILSFPGTPLPAIPFNQVIASQLAGLGCVALIGRDILQGCMFVYNGVEGIWTVSF